jgi:hypothetical protein
VLPLPLARVSLFLAAGLSGCFAPTFGDGAIACGEAGCPPGLTCGDDGFCYADPPGGPGDPGATSRELMLAVGHDSGVRVYAMCAGELRSVWTASAGGEVFQVAWGDVDADGIPELAAANMGGAAVIYTRTADGFAERLRPGDVAPNRAIALLDIDGDGDDDLVVGHHDGLLRLYRSNGNTMESSWSSSSTHSFWELAAGDFDGDGDPDLSVAVKQAADMVYRNDGGSLSLYWSTPHLDETEAVAWGDVDGDGLLDLAVGGTDAPARIYRFDGAIFSPLWESPLYRDDAEALDFADYDQDGRIDLAIGNWDDPDRIFRNSAGALVESWSSEAKADDQGGGYNGTESLAWGDFDGDGDPDLHIGRHGSSDVLMRNDDGTFRQAWQSPERDYTRSARWFEWDRAPGHRSLCDL